MEIMKDYSREFIKRSSDGLIKFSLGSGRKKSRRIKKLRHKNNKFRNESPVEWHSAIA